MAGNLTVERVSALRVTSRLASCNPLSTTRRAPGGTFGASGALLTLLLALLLNACGTLSQPSRGPGGTTIEGEQDGAPPSPIDVASIAEPVPRVEPRSKYGNPASYEVYGKRYYTLANNTGYVERGIASWYGTKFHQRRTSSGEPYDLYGITAAHKTLPLPSYVRVTNLRNGRTLIVRVNDRGPFHDNRLIDLSYAAASKLGVLATGTGLVEVRAIDPRATATAAVADTPPAPAPGVQPAAVNATAPPAEDARRAANLYLQVGAFLSRANAEQLRSRLLDSATAGIEIIQAHLNQDIIYRVRLGPMRDVAEADRMAEVITQLGLGAPHLVID